MKQNVSHGSLGHAKTAKPSVFDTRPPFSLRGVAPSRQNSRHSTPVFRERGCSVFATTAVRLRKKIERRGERDRERERERRKEKERDKEREDDEDDDEDADDDVMMMMIIIMMMMIHDDDDDMMMI